MESPEKKFWITLKTFKKKFMTLVILFPLVAPIEIFLFGHYISREYSSIQAVVFITIYFLTVGYYQWKSAQLRCPKCGNKNVVNYWGNIEKAKCDMCYFSYAEVSKKKQ
jgi:uncharacterized membrane protein